MIYNFILLHKINLDLGFVKFNDPETGHPRAVHIYGKS